MEIPPPHVLAQLDAIIVGQSSAANEGGGSGETDEGGSSAQSVVGEDEDGDSTVAYDSGDETAPYVGEGGARTTSSRFWGVTWHRQNKKRPVRH